jgi:hypothetical protein
LGKDGWVDERIEFADWSTFKHRMYPSMRILRMHRPPNLRCQIRLATRGRRLISAVVFAAIVQHVSFVQNLARNLTSESVKLRELYLRSNMQHWHVSNIYRWDLLFAILSFNSNEKTCKLLVNEIRQLLQLPVLLRKNKGRLKVDFPNY